MKLSRAISPCSAFTMIEIAICLAIIGFALVAIIGVLPLGMNAQRANREETVIAQDAAMLLETIRSGSHGADDLTNYVFAITNNWGYYTTNAPPVFGTDGYTFTTASLNGTPAPFYSLTNGAHIVGVLGTPEFVANGRAISDTNGVNYTSNHIVAYVRSLSGLAAEKPPQDNQIMREDTFGYRLLCVNAPQAFYSPPLWQAGNYNAGDHVTYISNGRQTYWLAVVGPPTPLSPPQSADVPGNSARWVPVRYLQELAANQRELRLTFLWPQLPNGNVGAGRQTFRATVAGQLTRDTNGFYFYQPQAFTNAP